jgi:hypothetical protein
MKKYYKFFHEPRNGFMKKAPNSSFNVGGNIGSGSLDGEMGGG